MPPSPADGSPCGVAGANLCRTKRFYAMAQYSQFIRPNYTILSAHDPQDSSQSTLTVAAQDPSTGTVYLVTTNPNGGPQRAVSYDLGSLGIMPVHASVYRTTASGNVALGPDAVVSGSTIMDAQPPTSITTYVITRAAPAARAASSVVSPAPAGDPGGAPSRATATSTTVDPRLVTESVVLDGSPASISSVTCGDRTVDGRERIMVRLAGQGELEVRADGLTWYRSKVLGSPMAQGGVSRFQAAGGAAVDAVLDGHRLTAAIRCE
jgi:hypothetical protein